MDLEPSFRNPGFFALDEDIREANRNLKHIKSPNVAKLHCVQLSNKTWIFTKKKTTRKELEEKYKESAF